jgi:hypothetical protein
MSEQIHKYQAELAKLIKYHTGQDGGHGTAIPSLFFSHFSNAAGPFYGVHKPSLCIVVQGMKEVLLSQELFRYGPADYLFRLLTCQLSGR